MIETLSSATLAETGETTEPVLITGITFEDGDLCKARYPTLINYDRAPVGVPPVGVQFEPGFQILSPGPQLEFLLQLDPEGGIELSQEIVSLDADSLLLGVEVDWIDSFTCRLTFDGVEGKVAALRLPCRPSPGTRVISDKETVYGGVYLAIINREETLFLSSNIGVSDPPKVPETIQFCGLDVDGRPVYDLFQPEALPSLPSYLGLEPTFRVHRSEKVSLSLKIATISDLEFEEVAGDQVKVQPFQPPIRPPELKNAGSMDGRKRCDLLWEAAAANEGFVSTFYLDIWPPADSGRVDPSWKRRRIVQVDPTVIQPPSCSGPICV